MADAMAEAGTDAGSGPRTIVERPEAGLARGQVEFPAAGIAAIGVAVVLIAVAYAWVRWRKR